MIEEIEIYNKSLLIKKIVLKDYVEENSEFLRDKYLNIINELSELKIEKKKIRDYFFIKNHSLWEMSLLREKNPLKSSKIYSVIKYLACQEIIKKYYEHKIILKLFDYDLFTSLKKFNSSNIDIQFKNKINSPLFKFDFTIYKIIKFIIKNYNFNNFSKVNYNGDVLVLAYFAHFIETKNGIVLSAWKNLNKIIEGKINWMFIFHPSKKFKKRNDIPKSQKLTFIFDFLSFKVISLALLNYIKFSIKFFKIKKKLLNTKNDEIKTILKIQKNDLFNSFMKFNLFENLIWIFLFENILTNLPRKKLGIYLFENQAWEKAFLTAWKNNKHGKSIGYTPTTINFWYLPYFHSKNEDKNRNHIFAPNYIFSHSEHNTRQLKKFNLFDFEICDVEALRYNYLENKEIVRNSDNNNILFLGDYSDDINLNFLNSFKIFKQNNPNFNLHVKPHPASLLFTKKNIKENYQFEIVESDIFRLCSTFNLIISSTSTSAGIEFLMLDKNVLLYDDYLNLDLSPFKGSYIEYFRSLDKIKNIQDHFKINIENKKYKNFYYLNSDLTRWKTNLKKVFSEK